MIGEVPEQTAVLIRPFTETIDLERCLILGLKPSQKPRPQKHSCGARRHHAKTGEQ